MISTLPLHGSGFLSSWDEIAIVLLLTVGVFVVPTLLKKYLAPLFEQTDN